MEMRSGLLQKLGLSDRFLTLSVMIGAACSGGQRGPHQRDRRRGLPQLRAPAAAPGLWRRCHHARTHRRVSISYLVSLPRSTLIWERIRRVAEMEQ